MSDIIIAGAGMAGLLAANLVNKRGVVKVVEAQPSLPNNHSAILRFRTNDVGEALRIPFRKVTMIKDTLRWRNPVADALAYSYKCNGVSRSDRSVTAGLVVGERWIAPNNFIDQMAEGLNIEFGTFFDCSGRACPVISTLPMPVLMKQLGYPRINDVHFQFATGINVKAIVPYCEAYVTLMVPDPDKAFSRVSITGDELIAEVPRFNLKDFETEEGRKLLQSLGESIAQEALMLFGFDKYPALEVSVHKQLYSKILPIDDDIRRDFIYWATHNHNVFSLGRFATWRPGLLLDDLIKDIDLINMWVNSSSKYAVARHR